MDTDDYPSLPNLNQLHARLATNSRLVEQIVDSQLDGIERLFTATTAGDWAAIAKASRYLASLQADQVGPDVVREARHVFEELSHPMGCTKQPKHLDRLLAACREYRKKSSK